MTVNRGPGVTKNGAIGTTTVEHRLQLAGLYAENAPGVPRSGVMLQAATVLVTPRSDMSWDVGPAPLVINRTAGEGVYTPTLTGTTNVPTIAAPGSDSRWDLVYVKQNDMAKGDADNDAVIGVVNGTAASSPTKPYGSVPAGGLVLSESRIFASTTGTSGGSNTTSQVWRHTAARGARILIRDATERAEITTPTLFQEIVRLDQQNTIERWNGTSWDHFGHSEWTFAATGIPSETVWGTGALTADGTNTTDSNLSAGSRFITTPGSDRLTFRDAGEYEIDLSGTFSTAGTGRSFMQIGNGSTVSYKRGITTGDDTGGAGIATFLATAGQTIFLTAYLKHALSGPGYASWTGRVRVTRSR